MVKNIEFSPNISTEEAAQLIFEFLNIEDFEVRDSENYPPDGEYFQGQSELYKIKIYAVNDSATSTHRISIHARLEIANKFVKDLIEFLNSRSWQVAS